MVAGWFPRATSMSSRSAEVLRAWWLAHRAEMPLAGDRMPDDRVYSEVVGEAHAVTKATGVPGGRPGPEPGPEPVPEPVTGPAEGPATGDVAASRSAVTWHGTGFAGGWRGALRLTRGDFRSLVSGQAVGQLADGLAQISFAQLVLFEVGRGATPARIATVLAATLVPFSVAGPLAGVFIDRWDRQRTLVVASWLRAALAVAGIAAALARAEVFAYVGVILLLSSSRFVLDAKGAVLPRTVAPEDLVRANAISGLLGMTAAFVGGVGGAMFVSASVEAGFLAAAVCYSLAAVLFARLPFEGGRHREVALGRALGRLVRELGEGIRVTAVTGALRRPLLAVWTHRLLLGAGFIVLVLVADSRYHLSVAGYGLALAVTGISAFAGTVTAPYLVRRWRPQALLPIAFLPPAAGAIVAGYYPGLVALLVAVGGTAFAFQCLKVLTDALVGRAAPDAVRGRVFSLYDVLYNVAFVVAGLLMVPLWHHGSPRALLWLVGGLYAAGWFVFAAVVHGWPFGTPLTVRAATAASAPLARRHRWRERGMALCAGALPVLIFPRLSLGFLAWVVLVPWLMLLRRAPSPRRAVAIGWWGGAGFIVAVHAWLIPSTSVLMLVIGAVLGMLWIPWALLAHRLLSGAPGARRVAAATVVLPSAWLLVEAIRSASGIGGPWGLLGASQWQTPAFLAPASLGGAWLVSGLVVAVNVCAVVLIDGRRWTPRVVAAGVATAALLVGPVWAAVGPQPSGGGVLRVAMVQVGVVHDGAARLQKAFDETEALPAHRYDLIVWGESSVAFDLDRRPDVLARLQDLSARMGSQLLVNVDAAAANGSIRKMSVLVGPGGILGTYSKQRLVPFGEYIPLRPVLGWLASVTKAAALDRVRGNGIRVLHAQVSTGDLAFAPLICFESAFPDMARTAVRDGADVIIYQSATTTFQGTWAPEQHASLAAVRAVETGRPVLHATLSGTSAAFDATGKQFTWVPQGAGATTFSLPLARVTTPFDVAGDWVPATSFAVLAAAAVVLSLIQAAGRGGRDHPVQAAGDPVLTARG